MLCPQGCGEGRSIPNEGEGYFPLKGRGTPQRREGGGALPIEGEWYFCKGGVPYFPFEGEGHSSVKGGALFR